jgi:hypothetical protein
MSRVSPSARGQRDEQNRRVPPPARVTRLLEERLRAHTACVAASAACGNVSHRAVRASRSEVRRGTSPLSACRQPCTACAHVPNADCCTIAQAGGGMFQGGSSCPRCLHGTGAVKTQGLGVYVCAWPAQQRTGLAMRLRNGGCGPTGSKYGEQQQCQCQRIASTAAAMLRLPGTGVCGLAARLAAVGGEV